MKLKNKIILASTLTTAFFALIMTGILTISVGAASYSKSLTTTSGKVTVDIYDDSSNFYSKQAYSPDNTTVGLTAYVNGNGDSAIIKDGLPNTISMPKIVTGYEVVNKTYVYDQPGMSARYYYPTYSYYANALEFSNINTIGNYNFSNLDRIETITINNVTNIGEYSFSEMDKLSTVNFSNTAQNVHISAHAFENSNVSVINCIGRVKSYGEDAFKGIGTIDNPATFRYLPGRFDTTMIPADGNPFYGGYFEFVPIYSGVSDLANYVYNPEGRVLTITKYYNWDLRISSYTPVTNPVPWDGLFDDIDTIIFPNGFGDFSNDIFLDFGSEDNPVIVWAPDSDSSEINGEWLGGFAHRHKFSTPTYTWDSETIPTYFNSCTAETHCTHENCNYKIEEISTYHDVNESTSTKVSNTRVDASRAAYKNDTLKNTTSSIGGLDDSIYRSKNLFKSQYAGLCGDNAEYDDIIWHFEYGDNNENKIIFTGEGDMKNYDGLNYFYTPWYLASCPDVVEMVFDDRITSIGDYTANGQFKLKYYNMPASVTRIGNYAFCDSIVFNMDFTDKITYIGDYAYFSTRIGGELVLDENVTYLGEYAFSGTFIPKADIANIYTKIPDGLFSGCANLASFTIKSNIIEIGDYAFYNTLLGGELELNNVIRIGNSAFYNTWFNKVILDSSISYIGEQAFYKPSELEILTIGSDGKIDDLEIGAYAFACDQYYNCDLIRVTINCDSPTIGQYAFLNIGKYNQIYKTLLCPYSDNYTDEWWHENAYYGGYFNSTHIHNYNIVANKNSLVCTCDTLVCKLNDNGGTKLTVDISDSQYTGNSVYATVTGFNDWVVAGFDSYDLTYEAKNGSNWTKVTGNPVNIGSYRAALTSEGVTAYKEFNITKIVVNVTIYPVYLDYNSEWNSVASISIKSFAPFLSKDLTDLPQGLNSEAKIISYFVNGETKDYAPTYKTDYVKGSNIGNYNINADPVEGNIYKFVFDTGNIVCRQLKINDVKITLSNADNLIYNNDEKTPNVTVLVSEDGGKNYNTIDSSQFSVSYGNNINAGTASVTVSSNNTCNYSFSNVKTNFTINPKEVVAIITINEDTFEFIPGGIKPTITSCVNPDSLVIGSNEYTVNYEDNTKVGKGKIVLSDNAGGNFIVSGQKEFDIIPSTATITIEHITSTQYTGNKIEPNVVVKAGGLALSEDEYQITYSNNIYVGKATITVTNIGTNFSFTKVTGNFDITAMKFEVPITATGFEENTAAGFGTQYTGEEIKCQFYHYYEQYMNVTGNMKTNPGVYAATFELKDKVNTSWSDSTTENKNVKWKIDYHYVFFSVSNYPLEYNGELQGPVTSTMDISYINVTYEPKKDVGNYQFTASLKNKDVYRWHDTLGNEDRNANWSIAKLQITKPYVYSNEYSYNFGNPVNLSFGYFNDKYETLIGEIGIELGTYTIEVAIKEKNNVSWNDGTNDNVSFTYNIVARYIRPELTLDEYTYEYTGEQITPKYNVICRDDSYNLFNLPESEYRIEFGENKEVGSLAQVFLIDKEGGNYIFDPVDISFSIVEKGSYNPGRHDGGGTGTIDTDDGNIFKCAYHWLILLFIVLYLAVEAGVFMLAPKSDDFITAKDNDNAFIKWIKHLSIEKILHLGVTFIWFIFFIIGCINSKCAICGLFLIVELILLIAVVGYVFLPYSKKIIDKAKSWNDKRMEEKNKHPKEVKHYEYVTINKEDPFKEKVLKALKNAWAWIRNAWEFVKKYTILGFDYLMEKGTTGLEKATEIASEAKEQVSLADSTKLALANLPSFEINKKEIADYIEKKYSNSIINRKDNYVPKTKLPLADTHYVTISNEGKVAKSCFIYVYELEKVENEKTSKAILLLLKANKGKYKEYLKSHSNVKVSAFPIGGEWLAMPIDKSYKFEDVTKLIDETYKYQIDVLSEKETKKKQTIDNIKSKSKELVSKVTKK